MTSRYIVIVIGIAAITGSYWFAADPPNPWIFAIAAAAILVSIGITIAKKRAGHFKNN
jgi:hypothetical protein